jgi:hypothetical protein
MLDRMMFDGLMFWSLPSRHSGLEWMPPEPTPARREDPVLSIFDNWPAPPPPVPMRRPFDWAKDRWEW